MTEEQYQAHQQRNVRWDTKLPRAIAETAKRVTRRRKKTPNKLETEFRQRLELAKRDGQLVDYGYERITLKLAHDTRLTPDYDAITSDGRLSFFEVKGPHQWEDSWVKLKVAAALYPHFAFHLCKKPRELGGHWDIRKVPSS
jgi:hypothetical protein